MIVIFSGDSFFSLILAKRLIDTGLVSRVIVSRIASSSRESLKNVFNQTSVGYFFYRGAVEIASRLIRNGSVSSAAKRSGVELSIVETRNELKGLRRQKEMLGVACNFDSIIQNRMISEFPLGIINFHASDLPKDKGISPVVWAYCRGEKSIIGTIYKMDGGVDTGEPLAKFNVWIDESWSLFRTYCEVLAVGAIYLENVALSLIGSQENSFQKKFMQDSVTFPIESYNSWPSPGLDKMMRKFHRRYFGIRDLAFLFEFSKF